MKKLISLITVAVLLMAMTITVLAAFPDPTVDKASWKEANNFSPVTFKAGKATGAINIDGAVAVDSAYGSGDTITVRGFSEENLLETSGGATGEAKVAWDDDYIYLHLNVTDNTKKIGSSFDADSVEVYLDYDQKADGKKVMWNGVNSSDTYSAQYRIQRGGSTVDNAVGADSNSVMGSVGNRAKVKVVENGTAGYVVEAQFPLKDESGKYIPVSNVIGFELQINDNKNGTSRYSAAYIQGGLQYYAYEYSSLFDNIMLDGASDIAWSTRTVKTDVNEKLRDFDPNSKYVPSKAPSTASKKPSSAAQSKVSSAAESKVSSVAASTPSTVSTVESQGAADIFVKPDNYATVVLVTINPQFNLYLDEASDVLAVEPVNADAKNVIGDVTQSKGKFESVINSLIAAVNKGGFVKDKEITVNFSIAEVKSDKVDADKILSNAKEAANNSFKDLDVDGEVSTTNSDTTNTIGAEDEKGGMSTAILIAIIAGGVLLLAAAGVAVFFVIKKKKAQ